MAAAPVLTTMLPSACKHAACVCVCLCVCVSVFVCNSPSLLAHVPPPLPFLPAHRLPGACAGPAWSSPANAPSRHSRAPTTTTAGSTPRALCRHSQHRPRSTPAMTTMAVAVARRFRTVPCDADAQAASTRARVTSGMSPQATRVRSARVQTRARVVTARAALPSIAAAAPRVPRAASTVRDTAAATTTVRTRGQAGEGQG